MGYQELPPASWNYRGYYSGMSALKSVEDLSIKEKLGMPSLATADADVLDTHIQSHESQAGTPHRMLHPAVFVAEQRNPLNLGHKNSVVSPIMQGPSQVTPNKSSPANKSHGADQPNPSVRRVRQQPNLNPRRSIGPRKSMEVTLAQRRVKQQESQTNSSRGFDHQQRTISPSSRPRGSKESAKVEASAKPEALSTCNKGVDFDRRQCTTPASVELRNGKELAQAQALAKLEALSVRDSGVELDHQQRPTSLPPESPSEKEIAQAEALAKLEALSVRNRGTEFDHRQRTTSPPTNPRDSKESAQAQEEAKPEALSTSSNQDHKFNHEQHIASTPIASRNTTKIGHRQAKVNLLVASSFSTYNIFEPHQSNAPPATESPDSIEFASILPNLESRRQASHRAASSSQVIMSVTPYTKPQRSFAPPDNVSFELIPPNLQTRRTGKPKVSSSRGKGLIHPIRMPGVRRLPRASCTPYEFGSFVLQRARKFFGRSKKRQPGKFSPIMPHLRVEPKGKGSYDPYKKANGEIFLSESRRSRPDPSQHLDSIPPRMIGHTSSEKNMSSRRPAQHGAAQSPLGISSPLATHLGSSNAPGLLIRNQQVLPSAAIESISEVPWMARDSLSIARGPRAIGVRGDSHMVSFRDEEGRAPESKLGKWINWRAFLPEIGTFLKEDGEFQGMTTEWKGVESGGVAKGGIMTTRGRLERYM